MKPFAYEAPTSVSEALALLADEGRDVLPLAGGTDLLVQLRRRERDADLVVDVKKIPELVRLSFDPAGGLTVGAAITCARICEHPDVLKFYPALVDAASIIGGTAIRGRATLGGNLCNAAPSADSIPAMIVLGAAALIVGPNGERTVPVDQFCTAPGETAMETNELLVSIHFPTPPPRSGACYLRFTPREEMDIAVAGAGAWIALSEDMTTITDVRIALSAAAPTPLPVPAAGAVLIGKAPTEEAFTEAAAVAREAAEPITDQRGTADQRRYLCGILARRALRIATDRAHGKEAYS
jgi:carbon-monoxide dehydrogenase medium subunit